MSPTPNTIIQYEIVNVQFLIFRCSTKNEYAYLLAKVEHSGFVDEDDFSFKTGFSTDKKSIWKSCLFYCEGGGESIKINHGSIYSNTVAKYWNDDFLELDEMITDETNTQKAFKAIDEALTRNVKKTAPNDYTVIRNSVILYFKKSSHFDYNSMVNNILGEYQSTDMSTEGLLNLKEKLMVLPDIKHFDHQFNPVPAVINSRIKKIYKVNEGIEIKVTDYIDNIKETINAIESDDGTRYLRIKTNNDETFNYFK